MSQLRRQSKRVTFKRTKTIKVFVLYPYKTTQHHCHLHSTKPTHALLMIFGSVWDVHKFFLIVYVLIC